MRRNNNGGDGVCVQVRLDWVRERKTTAVQKRLELACWVECNKTSLLMMNTNDVFTLSLLQAEWQYSALPLFATDRLAKMSINVLLKYFSKGISQKLFSNTNSAVLKVCVLLRAQKSTSHTFAKLRNDWMSTCDCADGLRKAVWHSDQQ